MVDEAFTMFIENLQSLCHDQNLGHSGWKPRDRSWSPLRVKNV